MKSLKIIGVLLVVFCVNTFAIKSITTDYTITKVRIAHDGNKSIIVGSAYTGVIVAYDYQGKKLWGNELSGFLNNQIKCEDITGDNKDEILAANADGNLYCLSDKGEVMWKFKHSDTPMYAVAVVHKDKTAYIVCGDYSGSIFYLSTKGNLLKEIKSTTYSEEKSWGVEAPPKNKHIANFLNKIKMADGTEKLAVLGANTSMQTSGGMYLFNVMEDKPYSVKKIKSRIPQGYMLSFDVDHDGTQELLLGSSEMIQSSSFTIFNLNKNTQQQFDFRSIRKDLDHFGYVVEQVVAVKQKGETKLLSLLGNNLILTNVDLKPASSEVLRSKCSYNDMCYDANKNLLILASAQSGGNDIHIIDLNSKKWEKEYQNLIPKGNIQTMLHNKDVVHKELKSYKKPANERNPLPVYLMTESTKGVESLVDAITQRYTSPKFLNNYFSQFAQDPNDWNRNQLGNEAYKTRRDRRKKYTKTQKQIVDAITPKYEGKSGLATWGGHGNDPYYYSNQTLEKIIKASKGKKTVFIYPELEAHDKDFQWVLNNKFYPLAKYMQGKNANIYVRTKNIFWQSTAYMPQWDRMQSGEFSDVFIPSMEETTCKTMEQSVAARMGYWLSGCVDSWGARCARDNTSFDRMRQFSNQAIPNHFLRQLIYRVANGATYLNNFAVDQNYMSVLWELIAKGALYVPKRNELLSISPVHLGMLPPDKDVLQDGTNTKWLTFYDATKDKEPRVFSRLNGSWPGAPVTKWDFSSYAAGVKDRRLHFLPPYSNGVVLMTPIQKGKFTQKNVKRKPLVEQLNPIYKNIMKEYVTDGKKYYSADGTKTYSADTYYKVIKKDIIESAKKLPLTVTGNVAWVVAQTGPRNLRLTIIDGGYINPKNRVANITFNTVKPVKMVDILDGKSFDITKPLDVKVDVSCGLFRFIDITLSKNL